MTLFGRLLFSVTLYAFFYLIVQDALDSIFCQCSDSETCQRILARYSRFQRRRFRHVRRHHSEDHHAPVKLLLLLMKLRMVFGLAVVILCALAAFIPEYEAAALGGIWVTILGLDLPMWLFVIFMTKPVPNGREWKLIDRT